MRTKYPLPPFLLGCVSAAVYARWLARKAAAHVKRDRARGNSSATISAYKEAIHAAVIDGGEHDAYAGEPLRWDLISKYDNSESERGGREYKQRFADMPTADHVCDGLGVPEFRICAWRTNDAKSDLSYEDFIRLCRAILAHTDRRTVSHSVREVTLGEPLPK